MRTPEYGNPSPLPPSDVSVLQAMDRNIWHRSKDDFGHVHAFPEKRLSAADQSFLLDIIGRHVLPCVLTSGPYGELSFSVFNHTEVLGVHPERVISLSEEHFGLKGDLSDWPRRFREMSKVTHSDRNRQVLAFYEMPEPGPAEDYEY